MANNKINKFIKYGFTEKLSEKLVEKNLTISNCKSLAKKMLVTTYKFSEEEAKLIKKTLAREKITTDDMILLWSRAAGQCAICQENLLVSMKESGNVRIGEMAHILPDSIYGPRADDNLKGDVIYDNLILLCPTHHTLIDKAPDDYPIKYLIETKNNHEESVSKHAFQNKMDMPFLLNLLNGENKNPEIQIILEVYRKKQYSINFIPKKLIKKLFPDHGYYVIGITIKNIGEKLAKRTTIKLRPKSETFKEDIYFSIYPPKTKRARNWSFGMDITLGQINRGEMQLTKHFFYINYTLSEEKELFNIMKDLEFEYYLTCDNVAPITNNIRISNFQS